MKHFFVSNIWKQVIGIGWGKLDLQVGHVQGDACNFSIGNKNWILWPFNVVTNHILPHFNFAYQILLPACLILDSLSAPVSPTRLRELHRLQLAFPIDIFYFFFFSFKASVQWFGSKSKFIFDTLISVLSKYKIRGINPLIWSIINF